MYADKVTDSMQKTIDETERRRSKQMLYNKEHGITPTPIVKKTNTDLIDLYTGAQDEAKVAATDRQKSSARQQSMKKLRYTFPPNRCPMWKKSIRLKVSWLTL